jgi:hypothetical protein
MAATEFIIVRRSGNSSHNHPSHLVRIPSIPCNNDREVLEIFFYSVAVERMNGKNIFHAATIRAQCVK